MSIRNLSLPSLTIEVNAMVLDDSERAAIGELRICQKLSLPAQCELSFFNQPASGLMALLIPGATLRIKIAADPNSLFFGDITAVEHLYEGSHGRRLRIRAYDRLHRLAKRQPVRAHIQTNLAEMAQNMAAAAGLELAAVPTNPVWRRLIQQDETDLELLSQMTEAFGLYFTVREETLHFITLEGAGEAVPLTLGDTLLEARVEVNSDPSCRNVAAAGWDPLRVVEHSGRASKARTGHATSPLVAPELIGGTAERTLVHQVFQDDSHAEALAQAELDIKAGREMVLRGLAEGDPRLMPGAKVEVQGLGADTGGSYVLTEVTHVFDQQQGFVSELSTYPGTKVPKSRGASVMLGKVSSIDDPDNLGRVQVTLPAGNGVETDWMGVMSAGAGKGKGLMILPDVGDTVLIVCAQEDPAHGIVLGGLYSTGGPPDNNIENRSVARFSCLTPGGQRLRFDDINKSIRLENSEGSFIELKPGKVVVHGTADLDIEAPGKTITIRANAIDFQQG